MVKEIENGPANEHKLPHRGHTAKFVLPIKSPQSNKYFHNFISDIVSIDNMLIGGKFRQNTLSGKRFFKFCGIEQSRETKIFIWPVF